MKKLLTKAKSLLLVVAIMMGSLSANAYAATGTYYAVESGTTHTYTFTANKSGTCTYTFTMTQGSMKVPNKNVYSLCDVYASYDIHVYEGSTKICTIQPYCTKKKSVSFPVKKGKEYKIVIYNWNVETTAKSYVNNGKVSVSKDNYAYATRDGLLRASWNRVGTISYNQVIK